MRLSIGDIQDALNVAIDQSAITATIPLAKPVTTQAIARFPIEASFYNKGQLEEILRDEIAGAGRSIKVSYSRSGFIFYEYKIKVEGPQDRVLNFCHRVKKRVEEYNN